MSREAGKSTRPLFMLGAGVISLLATLLVAEALLRVAGFGPWKPAPLPEVPIMQEPDAELGWRNKVGVYEFEATPPIVMTFRPGGFRATGPDAKTRSTQVLVLGGSFTQGWAVTDHETYAYLLQEQMPNRQVLNLGTAGYGAYQSLLALDRYLDTAERAPAQIIFGFNDFHQERDVAAPAWLRMLSELSHMGAVAAPFATLGKDGSLERHAPMLYANWPGKRSLASVAFLEERTFAWASQSREQQATAVTEAVLQEMNAVAERAKSRLLVSVLSNFRPEAHRHYLDFLRSRNIANVDCAYPDDGKTELLVPRYGHPNATVNAYWGECIGEELKRQERRR